MMFNDNNMNMNNMQMNQGNIQGNMQGQYPNYNNQYQNNMSMNQNNPMQQYAMNSFRPLVPITVNKDYITTMIIASAIIIMLVNTSDKGFGLSFLGFLAILGYNIYCRAKIKRCGFKLTMAGSLLTDAIIFFVCTLIFVLVSKWKIGITITKITWWCIQCAIAQIITSIILDSEDKRKLKKLKNMEKQRRQYERKVNKIYGTKNK